MPFHDPFIPTPALRRWIFSLLLVALVLLGLLDVRLRSRQTPHRTINDYTVYYAAAHALWQGGDPYEARNARGDRYLYPPLLALLIVPLVPLGSEWAGVVWFFANVAFAFGCYGLLSSITSRAAPRVPGWLALGPILAVALPGVSCLQAGQLGIALLLLTLFALDRMLDGRPVSAGLALSLGVSLKVLPALPAAVIVIHLLAGRRYREVARFTVASVAGLVLFWVVLPSAVLGLEDNQRMLEIFLGKTVLGREEMNIESVANQSPWYAFARIGGEGGMTGATIIAVVIVILLAGVAVRTGSTRSAVSLAAATGLGSAAAVSLSPVAWAHYFVLVTPALLFVPLLLLLSGRSRSARLLSAIPVAIIVGHYLVRIGAPGTAIMGTGVSLWIVVASLAAWTGAPSLIARETSAEGADPDERSGSTDSYEPAQESLH